MSNGKTAGFEIQMTSIQIMIQSFKFSKPQLSHFCNIGGNYTYLLWLLVRINSDTVCENALVNHSTLLVLRKYPLPLP